MSNYGMNDQKGDDLDRIVNDIMKKENNNIGMGPSSKFGSAYQGY
jgi:hypothetical protein